MRILHVISSLDRKAGGPPVALAGLAIAQAKLGATVTVAATFAEGADRELAGELSAAGVAVTLIGPATGKFQRHSQIRPVLSQLITAADVAHIHTLWEEIQHQAAVLARKFRKPYVFVPHGMLDPWSLSQSRLVKKAYLSLRLRRDLNGAAFLHVLNEFEGSLLRPLNLRPPCIVVPNGIDLTMIDAMKRRIAMAGAIGAEFPEIGLAPYVLFLSRLHPKKGLDYLADAFAIVAKEFPEIKLVVAGPNDGAETDFDSRIRHAGLTLEVIQRSRERSSAAKSRDLTLLPLPGALPMSPARVFRIGPVYAGSKLDAYAGASVFVLPSRQEGFSVAIIEALASGVPVVISEQCHFPEVAEAGAGKIVPLSVDAIAAAIVDYLRDPAARAASSERGGALAMRYTWDEIAKQTLDLYSQGGLAILANSMTPYRIALHRRLANEIPSLHLKSLFTHASSNAPWELDPPREIGPVSFMHVRNSWQQGGRVIDWLKRIRPTAIIVNGYNDLARLRVLRWCRRNGVPAMLWGDSNIRGDRAVGVKAIVKSTLVRWAVRQAAGVMPCGSLGQAYFEKYEADPKQMIWMPYEPDYALIQNITPAQIESARERFHLPTNRRRIVYSGRLIPIKRVDLLLRAFADIAAERPNWDLVIIGDGPLRQSLAASVSPALSSRIQWTGFVDDQGAVSAIYRCCDVLAHPPDVEPWALVINEAAAAGLAIVASDVVGAAAELVRDGVNGRIFPAGDLAKLRAALLEVTLETTIDRYKAASANVLAAWRQRADPVQAVRQLMQRFDRRRDAGQER